MTSLDAVKNLKAEVEEDNISLTWNDADVDEYIIKRDGEQIATVEDASFAETLEDGVYHLTVGYENLVDEVCNYCGGGTVAGVRLRETGI